MNNIDSMDAPDLILLGAVETIDKNSVLLLNNKSLAQAHVKDGGYLNDRCLEYALDGTNIRVPSMELTFDFDIGGIMPSPENLWSDVSERILVLANEFYYLVTDDSTIAALVNKLFPDRLVYLHINEVLSNRRYQRVITGVSYFGYQLGKKKETALSVSHHITCLGHVLPFDAELYNGTSLY